VGSDFNQKYILVCSTTQWKGKITCGWKGQHIQTTHAHAVESSRSIILGGIDSVYKDTIQIYRISGKF